MFFYPIGRDEAEIRRHAWVSYTLIALNVIAFIVVHVTLARIDARPIEQKWNEIVRHLSEHPYLVVPPQISALLSPNDLALLAAERQERFRGRSHDPAEMRRQERREQARLNALVGELMALRDKTPFHRLGYKPSEGSFSTLITSMFVHGDFWHLLGNMLFFFVTGPFLEDVFGRPLFAILYFTGGAAATWTHAWQHPASDMPLVGASGAIAAVMGAYLFRFARSKFEFIWIPIIIRPTLYFRFFLPAYVVLPLWFATQFYLATQETTVSGVAVWAHVGGFVYGMIFFAAMKAGEVEEKFVNPAIEGATTWKQNEHIVRAREARARWDFVTARNEVDTLLRKEPDNVDAHRAGYEIAIEAQDWGAFARFSASLLDQYIRMNETELALDHIRESFGIQSRALSERFYVRAAQCAEKAGDRQLALGLYEAMLHQFAETAGGFRALMQAGKIYRQEGRLHEAKLTLKRAQSHGSCTTEWARTIDAQLRQIDGGA